MPHTPPPRFRSRLRPLAALAAVLALAWAGWAQSPAAVPAAPPNPQLIAAGFLRNVLYFLASDAMAGRYTPSRGLDTAALYIASNLSQWGLTGAGDPPARRDPKLGPLAPFLDHFNLQRTTVDPAQTYLALGGHAFRFGDDFATATVAGQGTARLLFVGQGYVVPQRQLDPYQGLDVKGKILVVDGEPSEIADYQRALRQYRNSDGTLPAPVNALGRDGIDYISPQEYAAAHGAIAVIAAHLPALPFAAAQPPQPGGAAANPYPAPPPDVPAMAVTPFLPPPPPVPTILAKPALWSALQRLRSHPNARLSFRIATTVHHAQAEDVVAVLPGSDPALRRQYVMLSAHLDHLGVGRPVNGDAIYNGADDDGSGSTALLALARAFAAGPRPKRSLVFIWHAGEEEGLWGSLDFTRFPTLPLANVVTDINMDMIGRTRPPGDTDQRDARLTRANEIYVIGPDVSSSDLEHTLETVNAATERLQLNHHYDRTDDPEHIFYRSDHFNYAAQGIPIVFFFDGVHRDYHQPGDEPQKIDYQKMEKVARTVYALAWQLAQQPTRPRLNADLPPALVRAMAAAKLQRAQNQQTAAPPAPAR